MYSLNSIQYCLDIGVHINTAGAQQIIQNGLLDFAGGLAGGIAAAEVVGFALAPLCAAGPAGAIIAGVATLLAGVAGGIGGEAAVRKISDMFGSDNTTSGVLATTALTNVNGTTTSTTDFSNGDTSIVNHDIYGNLINTSATAVSTAGIVTTTTSDPATGILSTTNVDTTTGQLLSSSTFDTITSSGATTVHNTDQTITQTNFSATGPSISTTYDANMHEISSTITRPDSSRATENYDISGNIISTSTIDDTSDVITVNTLQVCEIETANDELFEIRKWR
jgi:hypothetical protein